MANTNTVQVTNLDADQEWYNETTKYWFQLNGTDYGTGREFDDEIFGIAESNGEDCVIDSAGVPIAEGDWMAIAVRSNVTVTDEMRSAAAGFPQG